MLRIYKWRLLASSMHDLIYLPTRTAMAKTRSQTDEAETDPLTAAKAGAEKLRVSGARPHICK